MAQSVRRVVTGHDATGRAVVLEDGPAPVVFTNPRRPGYSMSSLWHTAGAPAALAASERDPTRSPHRLPPPENGTVFRITTFPPDRMRHADAEAAHAVFAAMGGSSTLTSKRKQPHALMHRTESVDYAIVLAGEITLILDDSEVRLRTGDVVIQRGTNHAWSNHTEEPCTMAFVLIDGVFEPGLTASIASFDQANS